MSDYNVNASSAFWLYHVESYYVSPIYLSAITRISLSDEADERGPFFVDATSSIFFPLIAPASLVRIAGPVTYFVSAAETILLRDSVGTSRLRAFQVVASNAITIRDLAFSGVGRLVSAASAFTVLALSGQVRDIRVAAATTLDVSLSPTSNQFPPCDATSNMVVTVTANRIVTGTLVSSRLVFTDRASAALWLPWRRSDLSLPPGGNIPHS